MTGKRFPSYDVSQSRYAGYLKSLIPVERGNIWSLKDCFEGNKDKGRKKVTELIKEVEKYPYLKESMFTFEGLVIGRGVHASGILIGNEPYVNQISAIRSPNNVLCSCYDLHDTEYRDWETDRKSTRLNSSHSRASRMPSSA